jgi:hypothetical protein
MVVPNNRATDGISNIGLPKSGEMNAKEIPDRR